MTSATDALAAKERALEADYVERRKGMLKLMLLAGSIVMLVVVAGVIGLVNLDGTVSDLQHGQTTNHACSLHMDSLLLRGVTSRTLPSDCVP